MGKIVLDIDQMKHLQKLGIDTSKASMCWVCSTKQPYLSFYNKDYPKDDDNVIPAFTLQDILDLLPESIITNDFHRDKVRLVVDLGNKEIGYAYSYETVGSLSYYYNLDFNYYGCLIDSAFAILYWCVKNGYVETKKDKS